MSRLLAACLLLAFGAGSAVQAGDDDRAQTFGNWVTERNEAVIRISPGAGGGLEGRVVHTPDPPSHGELILTGMHYDGGGSWSGGTIHDPRNGRSYHARLQLVDCEHLRVRGFIGIAFFGRTQVWTRYHGAPRVNR